MGTFSKGLITDTTPKVQPDGSYTFALNAVLETKEDGLGALINEIGNDVSASLPNGFRPIGYSLTDSDDVIIFAASTDESIIGLFNPTTKTFTSTVRNSCLGFSAEKPIEAIFRIRKGCNRTVYFTDNNNPYRVFDFDDVTAFQDELGNWDCNKFSFFPDLTVPNIDSVSVVDQGGELKLGAYQFALRYLDKDLNPTNFFYVTRPVNIYDDSIAGAYDAIDGGFNSTGEEGQLGAVPLTSKSIDLQISNLDLNFYYYQVAVIASEEGTGSASRVYLMPPQEINSSELVWTLGSVTSTGVTLTTVADIAVDAPVFDRVKTHATHLNRLFLGGVTTKEYNWADFQRAANDVTVSWFVDQVTALPSDTATFEDGNPKYPSTPFNDGTFQGDEIYALGVEFLHKNGTWSPEFHIPGREYTQLDLIQVTLGLNISAEDSAHLGEVGDKLPAWKVYNTSLADGTLAYHEANIDYPSLTCNGERIFPEGKVRHHRMPSRRTVPVYETVDGEVKLNLIKLQFDNLVYPHEDIVGHRWTMARRSPADTTVIDTALMIGPAFSYLNFENDGEPVDGKMQFGGLFESYGGQYEDTDVVRLISPKLTTLTGVSRGTYVTVLGTLSSTNNYRFDLNFDVTGPDTNGSVSLLKRHYDQDINSPTIIYRKIDEQIGLNIRSDQGLSGLFTDPLTNYSYSNNVRVAKLRDSVLNWQETTFIQQYNLFGGDEVLSSGPQTQNENLIYQVCIKKVADPFANIGTLSYMPLHSSPKTLSDDQTVSGDVYISEFSYYDLHSVGTEREGSILWTIASADVITRTWLESEVNFSLRHEGDDTCNRIWKIDDPVHVHTLNKLATYEEGAWTINETVCPEYYGYNRDYSKRWDDKPNFPLPNTAILCSSCTDEFNYRIYYSEQSFQEETSDMYRIFKTNSYRDLDGARGPITSMFVDKSQLYCLTPKALWFVPTSPQRLTTNEDNIYVGTGDVLSIPPSLLSAAQQGYGGASYQHTNISTEFGTFFIDDRSRKVFHLSEGLKEISSAGMSNFFEENIGLELDRSIYSQTGTHYGLLYPHSDKGIGYQISYDPKFRRVILSKKDYKPLYPVKLYSTSEAFQINTIYYDPAENNFYYYRVGSLNQISDWNPDWFENVSYTLSYSLDFRNWTSFHSYLPNMLFNDNKTFYSSIDHNLYDHSIGKFQTYYGKKYDHIIDMTFNESPGQTKVFTGVNYSSVVEKYSDQEQTYIQIPKVTFDKLVAYTQKQTSGFQDIVVKDGAFSNLIQIDGSSISAYEKDSTWYINELRDMSLGHGSLPLFTKLWVHRQESYFIDKVPTPSTVDPEKTQFERSRLRDKFMQVRFYFNPEEDYRISTDYILATGKLSRR